VTSLRSIKWDNMRPNFYMIFSPDVLAPFSQTWLGSYRLPPEGRGQRWNSSAATPR
jgi:putative ABC transport system permease protein